MGAPTQREYWSGKTGDDWAGHAEPIDAMLAPLTEAALAFAAFAPGERVLDIGCGRGEFLSLLKRNNIATRGIDLNGAMVQEAKALDLDVLEGDAIAYLRSLPDNSLAAITGFHIVEHISFKELVSLFDTANRVLMPGGLVLFETPNPENLVVGACTFNYDPTHNKPLPPDYLRFIAEARDEAQVAAGAAGGAAGRVLLPRADRASSGRHELPRDLQRSHRRAHHGVRAGVRARAAHLPAAAAQA